MEIDKYMLCSVCNKNLAVIFMTKIENGKQSTEGLCLGCAKERGINPINNMILPNNIISINEGAFAHCYNLTSIKIVDSVTKIGATAFLSCDALNSIIIGNGITFVDYSAFAATTILDFVYITDLSSWCNIHFDENTSNPLWYGSKLYLNSKELVELVIPEDITKIK